MKQEKEQKKAAKAQVKAEKAEALKQEKEQKKVAKIKTIEPKPLEDKNAQKQAAADAKLREKIQNEKQKYIIQQKKGAEKAFSGLSCLFAEKPAPKDPRCIRRGSKPKPDALINAMIAGANAARRKRTVSRRRE